MHEHVDPDKGNVSLTRNRKFGATVFKIISVGFSFDKPLSGTEVRGHNSEKYVP